MPSLNVAGMGFNVSGAPSPAATPDTVTPTTHGMIRLSVRYQERTCHVLRNSRGMIGTLPKSLSIWWGVGSRQFAAAGVDVAGFLHQDYAITIDISPCEHRSS